MLYAWQALIVVAGARKCHEPAAKMPIYSFKSVSRKGDSASGHPILRYGNRRALLKRYIATCSDMTRLGL